MKKLKKMKKILVISDVHAPYHDKKAFELVCKVAKEFKPDILIGMGDLVDCYSISAYQKEPDREANLKNELKEAIKLLKRLGSLAKEKVFLEGNHENRLERYLQHKAPELFGLVDIPTLLELDDWFFIPYKEFFKLGKVVYTHDLSYAGPNIARRSLSDAQHSIIVGHSHRISYAVEGDIAGKAKIGACFGWLGNSKKADYMHTLKANRDWALGFGIGYLDTNGITYFVPVPIIKNSCQVEGKIFKV